MLLRDTNLRFAALKLIRDAVEDAMKAEKADHLEALEASAEDSGAKSWTVTLGGEKVASVTLAQRAGGPKVIDEDALAAHLSEHRPELVDVSVPLPPADARAMIDLLEENFPVQIKPEVKIKPWAAKEILSTVVEVTEEGAISKDGEIFPGIAEVPPGDPYQSLRWDSKADGRSQVAAAIRSGELRDLLKDTGLPLIEP